MIPHHLIGSLANAADVAINRVLRTGATHVGQSPPTGEVGFVAALVIGGVPALASAWNPILKAAGYSVQLTGVFCHQSPMVDFTDAAGKPRRCELADLLVVVDSLKGAAPGRRWAALVQAKMAGAGGGQTLTTPGDLVQHELLSAWPNFTLPPAFSPKSRDFSTCRYAGVTLDCARYGLIDPQPSPAWRQQAPAISMSPGGMQIGSFLAHMTETGQTSYGREATGTADDWSLTVDELLKITGVTPFTYTRGFKGRQPRGVDAIAAFATLPANDPNIEASWSSMPPPSGGRPEQLQEGPPAQRISILRIGVRQH